MFICLKVCKCCFFSYALKCHVGLLNVVRKGFDFRYLTHPNYCSEKVFPVRAARSHLLEGLGSRVDNEADDSLFQACIYVLFPLKSLGEFRRDHKNSPSARTYRLLNHFNLLKQLHLLSKTVNQHVMRAITFIQI